MTGTLSSNGPVDIPKTAGFSIEIILYDDLVDEWVTIRNNVDGTASTFFESVNAGADSNVTSGKLVFEFRPGSDGNIRMYPTDPNSPDPSRPLLDSLDPHFTLKSASVELSDNNSGGNPGASSGAAAQNDGIILQVGANSGAEQRIQLSTYDMRCVNLGISDISIAAQSDAMDSIDIIDEAIKRVSDVRAHYGAAGNRLQSAIKNLDAAAENLTSAESRIRDADMAKSMMLMVKGSILSQAADAMLAQANVMPEAVLRLLR